jgi:hypothetical protein
MDLNDEMPKEWHANPDPVGINMKEIVGSHDILFICLDTLRWDVAFEEQEEGRTPILNQYGKWRKSNAPGNFTYPSHHAMFAGFLPSSLEPIPLPKQERLFFPRNIGLGSHAPKNSFAFEGDNFVEGLAHVGYETICIGGVAFFDKRSPIGKVFPSMFKQSYWKPKFSCAVKESFTNQLATALKVLATTEADKRVFMYINIDAIHYPNYFYVDGENKDSRQTHAAALHYVDSLLPELFSAFERRGKTFVIACSDHGTCYGEDGFTFHGFNHEIVNTVPYKHFVL